MKKKFFVIFLTFFFVLMLSFPTLTREAALSGLKLWGCTIVPTLLPFMIISGIITETHSYNIFSTILRPMTKYIFKLSYNTGYPIFIGMLCGFPMGSHVVSDMIIADKISVSEGNLLLTFCNNISPAFVISFICGSSLGLDSGDTLKLSISILSAPVITGFFLCHLLPQTSFFHNSHRTSSTEVSEANSSFSFEHCLSGSIDSILKLGGYIVFFSIICRLITLLTENFFLNSLLSAFLEITNGIFFLSKLESHYSLVLICAFASFGGLCAVFQTKAMLKSSKLNIFYYISGKIISAILSVIIFILLSDYA